MGDPGRSWGDGTCSATKAVSRQGDAEKMVSACTGCVEAPGALTWSMEGGG